MGDVPTEQEQAALDILLHGSDRERIRLLPGRLGDEDVALVVFQDRPEEGGRSWPLAMLLREQDQPYVVISQGVTPLQAAIAAIEAERARVRAEVEALRAEAERIEALIIELERQRRIAG
jgi:hypothetical protein